MAPPPASSTCWVGVATASRRVVKYDIIDVGCAMLTLVIGTGPHARLAHSSLDTGQLVTVSYWRCVLDDGLAQSYNDLWQINQLKLRNGWSENASFLSAGTACLLIFSLPPPTRFLPQTKDILAPPTISRYFALTIHTWHVDFAFVDFVIPATLKIESLHFTIQR